MADQNGPERKGEACSRERLQGPLWRLLCQLPSCCSTLGLASADQYLCDLREFCLYENNDLNRGANNTYGVYQWRTDDRDYNNKWRDRNNREHRNTDVLNDEASSLWDRTGCPVLLFQHKGWTGASSLFRGGVDDYSTNNRIGDNRVSSHNITCR